MRMKFDEFLCIVSTYVQEELKEEADVKWEISADGQGRALAGIRLAQKNGRFSLFLGLGKKYREALCKGNTEECIRWAVEEYREGLKFWEERLQSLEKLQQWENVKDRVFPSLFPKGWKEREQEGAVHFPFLDLEVCFYVRLPELPGMVTVREEQLAWWGVTEDDVREHAIHNLLQEEYSTNSITDIIKEMGVEETCMGKIGDVEDMEMPFPLVVATNRQKVYGAAAMLHVPFLDGYAQEKGANLFILPASTHELILIPDNGAAEREMLRRAVESVNREMVIPEERLSDHVYYYDRRKREVTVAV